MNELARLLPTVGPLRAGKRMRRLAALGLDVTRRGLALLLVWLMIPLGVADLSAFAQEAPPPPPDQQGMPPQDQGPPPEDQGAPPQQWNALSPDQLNQLVAPVALYPDSLVAQVLAASTYPTQVVDADRFVQANAGASPDQMSQMVNGQPWDPSVKALTAFPSVLSNMDKNLDWTTQLGNAYYNQPQDVMNAVQSMRQQAYQSGHLRTTPQLDVTYAPGDIVIAPVNPAVVYVPYYNPWAMWGFRPWYAYYAPPPPPGVYIGAGLALGFGIGIAIGAWSHWGWGWGHWGFAWGPHPYVAFDHATYISRSVTVVNHGYYGHFDRAPGARAYNMRVAANARAAGFNRGYAAGERNGYNRGAANGYNRGAAAGYNRGTANNYHAPAANGRPAQNYNRGVQNSGRPAQNYNRPAQNNGRSSNQRPARNQRQSTQTRPSGHSESRGDHSHKR